MNSFCDRLTRRSVLVRGSQAALALMVVQMKPLLAAQGLAVVQDRWV